MNENILRIEIIGLKILLEEAIRIAMRQIDMYKADSQTLKDLRRLCEIKEEAGLI